jgi:hypothetical protein
MQNGARPLAPFFLFWGKISVCKKRRNVDADINGGLAVNGALPYLVIAFALAQQETPGSKQGVSDVLFLGRH